MFCPVCKTEYREGFTRCSDCGVNLVNSLPAEPDLDPGPAEVLWAGIHFSTFARIKLALQEAQIPFEGDPRFSLMWTFAHQPYEIWTYKRDHAAAQRALDSVLGQPSLEPTAEQHEAQGNSTELTNDLPEELLNDPPGPVPDDLLENFDPDEATSEIWSGEEATLAKFLQDSLQANGIGSVIRAADADQRRLLVTRADEPRAREIIREVLDATPPE